MWTYYDFEDAYVKGNLVQCKEIGAYLLKKYRTAESKKLLKALLLVKPASSKKEDKAYCAKIIMKVKLWLMVNK